MTFFGVPFFAWGIVCLMLAVVFVFIYPHYEGKKPASRSTLFILHWFHPLVWVLLGIACILWDAGQSGYANAVAILAMPVYLVFLTTVSSTRQPARGQRKTSRTSTARKK